jgi:hypothetical protein
LKNEVGHLLLISEARKLVCPCVYALCDANGAAFYVGKTIRPWRRFAEHVWQRGGANLLVKKKIKSIGACLRVCILAESPVDINTEERRAIAVRPWVLNVVGPHHWVWQQRKDKPWAAGTGIHAPSNVIVGRMKDKCKKELCRAFLHSLSLKDRCILEINLYREFPLFAQRRLDKWLCATRRKMLECLEHASS